MSRDTPLEAPLPASPPRHAPELSMRLVSALVMASIAIAAVWASPWSFVVLVIAGAAIVDWEWSRLVRGQGLDAAALLQGATLWAIAVLVTLGRYVAAAAVVVAALIATAIKERDDARLSWSLFGLIYMALPTASLVWLRSDPGYGWLAVLFVLLVSWTTDTAAFAAGRLIGGPKLCPRISPKKTWSGFVAGIVLPSFVGCAFAIYALHRPGISLALVALVLAFACQLGDLAESAIKRHFGAKDASGLIPGHGGLLDRVDGFMLASPVAALIAFRDLAHPGHGLLLW